MLCYFVNLKTSGIVKMSDDELIIELDSPPPPSTPYVELAPDTPAIKIVKVVDTDTDTDTEETDTTFWLFSSENRELLIHAVSDVILFYLFFQYVSSKYAHTASMIQETEDQLKLMRKQYGIEKQKKKRVL